MKEKRRLRRIKVGCKILDTHTHGTHTDTHTHTRTVVLDDLIRENLDNETTISS